MKKTIPFLWFFLQFFVFASAQFQRNPNNRGAGYYSNPIFAGDYPDPSILRDGKTYIVGDRMGFIA